LASGRAEKTGPGHEAEGEPGWLQETPEMRVAGGKGEAEVSAGSSPVFRADDQLKFIRMIREKLTPEIRDQLVVEISSLASVLEVEERRKRLEERISDPGYCLEKIEEFLFPDQPELWEKVKPLIRPEEWRAIVLAREEGKSLPDTEKLERSRGVIREALKLKAEIEEEINYTPHELLPAGGKGHSQAIKKMLAGADDMLNFALKSISEILEETDPARVAGQP